MDRYYDKFARLTILEIPDKRVFTLFSCAATKKDFADTNILYDNKIVATTKDSGIITLPVADKKMKSDIIISLVNPASPIEISTEAKMTALLTSGEVGGVYKYTGTTGTYENGALYVLEEEEISVNGYTLNYSIDQTSWDVDVYIQSIVFADGTSESNLPMTEAWSRSNVVEVNLWSDDDQYDISYYGELDTLNGGSANSPYVLKGNTNLVYSRYTRYTAASSFTFTLQ